MPDPLCGGCRWAVATQPSGDLNESPSGSSESPECFCVGKLRTVAVGIGLGQGRPTGCGVLHVIARPRPRSAVTLTSVTSAGTE